MNAKRIRRVALYVRVSTDHQTVKNQERELEAVAERHGWSVVAVFKDQGIQRRQGPRRTPGPRQAAASGSAEGIRPGRRMVRRPHRPIAGRSGRHVDLVGTLQELHAKHVDLYLHQQGIDTTTPSGKAMFQMMGVFAEFERSMLRERVNAGLARARAEGTQLGRPAEIAGDAAKVKAIRAARAAGKSFREVAREFGVGVGTVQRLTA
jgi:DNA invertase Pin-like site-specific DNA recombinase